jgi:predicted transposase/invertase (TIGR01784 family)
VEREQSLHFGEILNLSSVRRIYLDELPHNPSLGIGVIKLVVESETEAVRTAQTLMERTREEITDQSSQRQLINLIESIIIYKLPQKSREEIEAMFGLSDLRQTRVYQEALAEGEERGLERGLQEGERLVVENLLRVRFGELDPPLQAIISRILQLSPEEFTPLLLHCSKQELLKRFSPEKSRGN